jgi:signal transduction histidine kinase
MNLFSFHHSIKTKVTLTTVAIFMVSLWSLALYLSQVLRRDMQGLLGAQQFSAVSILAEQINSELVNRIQILESHAKNLGPVVLGQAGALQRRLDESPALQDLFNSGVVALGSNGAVLAKTSFAMDLADYRATDSDQLVATLKAGRTTIGRPVMDRKLLLPVVAVAVPIRGPDGRVIGALSGLTHLGTPNFLDRIAQNHFGRTGGFLLVAPRYRLIVTASNKARIMEILPPSGRNPTIDRFLAGYEGSTVFRDARGVEVLTSTRNIPLANWQLALSLPTSEAFAPILAVERRMLLATIFLSLVMGGLTWCVVTRQLAPLATAKALAAVASTTGAAQSLPVIRQDEIGDMISGFNHLLQTLKQAETEKTELEARNRQLQKAESLGLMAASIAHHFNNRLQTIMASLEMVGEFPEDSSMSRYVGLAKQATARAAEVSRLLLVYLGQVILERKPRLLTEICQRNIAILRKGLPSTLTLESDCPEPGPVISADAEQIQQVLTSLVTNACEAMADGGGCIRVSIGTCGATEIPTQYRYPIGWQPLGVDHAFLAVADTGYGIIPADIEKLFDPFFSRKSVGRGLGLPVALGLVQAHGGGITVESPHGLGSVFRVHIPILPEAEPIPLEPPLPISRSKGGGTVLMVDDDELLLESTGALIESLGFKLLTARDGIEALEIFRIHQPEIRCVLTDLTMPRMDGRELLDALHQLDPNLPVILASGYDKVQALGGTRPGRAQAFLNKPFGLKQIRDAFGRVLGDR